MFWGPGWDKYTLAIQPIAGQLVRADCDTQLSILRSSQQYIYLLTHLDIKLSSTIF